MWTYLKMAMRPQRSGGKLRGSKSEEAARTQSRFKVGSLSGAGARSPVSAALPKSKSKACQLYPSVPSDMGRVARSARDSPSCSRAFGQGCLWRLLFQAADGTLATCRTRVQHSCCLQVRMVFFNDDVRRYIYEAVKPHHRLLLGLDDRPIRHRAPSTPRCTWRISTIQPCDEMSTRRKRIPHSAFALCARHVRRGCSRMTHRRPRQRSRRCEVQPTLASPPLAWTATERSRFPTHRRQSLQQQSPRKPWSANRPLLGKRSRPQPGQKVSLKSFKDLDHTGRSIHVPQCGAHAHVIALIPSTSHSGQLSEGKRHSTCTSTACQPECHWH